MSMFALVALDPGGVIAWLVVGLIAGFLASRFMGAGGYGLVGDIVVGIVGAFVGGLICGMFAVGDYGLVGSIVVAFIGACLLIWIVRMVAPRRGAL
jgi:uncharacterized membrane protein YeaQ/YmgE (transglycosylase-associated protein family)